MPDRSTENELLVMNQVRKKIDALPKDAQRRVVGWLCAKYATEALEPTRPRE